MKNPPVVEVFGPTIQGEGPKVGERAYFVRLGGCDYRCFWCDSLHAVLPELYKDSPRLDPVEVTKQIPVPQGRDPGWVVISGGNPLLADPEWLGTLTFQVQSMGYRVQIETQGSLPWRDLTVALPQPLGLATLDHLVVSPKPGSAGVQTKGITPLDQFRNFLQSAFRGLIKEITLKVVVFDSGDLTNVYQYGKIWDEELLRAPVGRFPLPLKKYLSIGTVPPRSPGTVFWGENRDSLGDSPGTLLERAQVVTDLILKDPWLSDWVVLPQLHVLLWGHEKGH